MSSAGRDPGPEPALERLADLVLEDAATRARREAHRARAEVRRLAEETEERLAALRHAARALGRTRGSAAERALEAEADREVAAVFDGARAAFAERFRRRLVVALGELPREPERYTLALARWARDAAAAFDRPVEVRTLRASREAVYEALLAAGADDFQVVGDPKVHVGFVALDADGRTVFDARPAALVAARQAEIDAALEETLEPFLPPVAEAR